MVPTKIIKNYALSLFENAVNLNIQDKICKQLCDVDLVLENNTKLLKVLCSPVVLRENKLRLINIVIDELKVEKILEHFLLLVVKNSRISICKDVILEYKELLDRSNNIKNVKVTVSKTLSKNEQEEIIKYLEKDFEQKIQVEFHCNMDIIGGIVVQYDSKSIDYSVAGVLARMSNNAELALLLK